ncbi:MAG: LEA type 2 family protein [Granulosicoccus sp.]
MTSQSRLWLVAALLLIMAIGCSSIPTSKPIAPKVEVANLEIVKLGFLSQDLAFTLNVFNPNDYDLPVNTLNFIATVANEAVAEGISDTPVRLLANSTTEVVIEVTTRVNKLLGKLLQSPLGIDSALDYNVTGFVKLDNWPARIPFNIDKSLSLDDS